MGDITLGEYLAELKLLRSQEEQQHLAICVGDGRWYTNAKEKQEMGQPKDGRMYGPRVLRKPLRPPSAPAVPSAPEKMQASHDRKWKPPYRGVARPLLTPFAEEQYKREQFNERREAAKAVASQASITGMVNQKVNKKLSVMRASDAALELDGANIELDLQVQTWYESVKVNEWEGVLIWLGGDVARWGRSFAWVESATRYTFLMWACYYGEERVVRLLTTMRSKLDLVAFINHRALDGRTPMHVAMERGFHKLAGVLRGELPGEEIAREKPRVRVPLVVPLMNGKRLWEAARDGHTKRAKEILAWKFTAHYNRKELKMWTAGVLEYKGGEYGDTPLLVACHYGQPAVISLLLDAGADHHAFDGNGWSPLMLAAYLGDDKSVALLLHAGAEVDFVPKVKGLKGQMPPLVAAVASQHRGVTKRGQLEVVRLLLSHEMEEHHLVSEGMDHRTTVDRQARDEAGKSAMDYLEEMIELQKKLDEKKKHGEQIKRLFTQITRPDRSVLANALAEMAKPKKPPPQPAEAASAVPPPTAPPALPASFASAGAVAPPASPSPQPPPLPVPPPPVVAARVVTPPESLHMSK